MPAQEPLLRTAGLTIRFGGVTALSGVDLTVGRGEIHALLGANGAGKTTLFNLVAGVYRPTAGTIRFAGRDVTGAGPDRRCRAGIARTFQIMQPFERLTVEQNVMCGALRHHSSMSRLRGAVQDLISAVGLADKRRDLAGTLSTGQRKRLELARAMATRPQLLLLDEITGGVDQPSLATLESLVRELNRAGVTILLIDHNTEFVASLAQRVSFLDGGKLAFEGPLADAWRNTLVRQSFLGDAFA